MTRAGGADSEKLRMDCEDRLRAFLSSRLDSLCATRGLSRAALAQAAGMSADELAQIETGTATLYVAPLWAIGPGAQGLRRYPSAAIARRNFKVAGRARTADIRAQQRLAAVRRG